MEADCKITGMHLLQTQHKLSSAVMSISSSDVEKLGVCGWLFFLLEVLVDAIGGGIGVFDSKAFLLEEVWIIS